MPFWPGPVMAGVGGVVGFVAAGIAAAAQSAQLPIPNSALYGWLAVAGTLLFTAGFVYVAIRQLRIRRHLAPERYRGPSILVLMVIAVGLLLIVGAPFGADALALLEGEQGPSAFGTAVLLFQTAVTLLLVSWLFVLRPGALAALPSLPGRNALGAIGAGIGWGVLGWVVIGVIAQIVVLVLTQFGYEVQPQVAERAIGTVEPWIVVVAVVVLAPIGEEVFFRGVVFNAWLRERGRRWAYIGSASLFGVIHADPVVILPIFVLGLGLAWVYRRANNLLAPIAMHVTVNAITVTLALLIRFEVIRLPAT